MKTSECPHCGYKQDENLLFCQECREEMFSNKSKITRNHNKNIAIKREKLNQIIAPRWKRFLGALIDYCIFLNLITLLFVYFIIPFLIGNHAREIIFYPKELSFINFFDDINLSFLFFKDPLYRSLFFITISSFYFIFFESLFSQTIGKMLLRTKVVNIEKIRPSLKSLIIRNLARIIPLEMLLIFGQDKRCGHDELSGTFVVEKSCQKNISMF